MKGHNKTFFYKSSQTVPANEKQEQINDFTFKTQDAYFKAQP